MNRLLCCVKAEFIKQKHSIFYPLHIGIPLVYILGVAALFWNRHEMLMTESFLFLICQITAVALPLVSALVCGLAADREAAAGNYQVILTESTNKSMALLAQLIMITIMCTVSILITFLGLSGILVIWNLPVQVLLFVKAGAAILLSVIPFYAIHLVLAYKAGIGICSIIGFGGIILSALGETSILDSFWIIIPYCWPIRFVQLIVAKMPITSAHMIAVLLAIAIVLITILWFNRWEGRPRVE